MMALSFARLVSRFEQLDRRIVFLLLGAAVLLPFALHLEMRAEPSERTEQFVSVLDKAIDTGKPLLVSVDFGPQTMAEMEPVLFAVMEQAFARKSKVVFLTFLPEAAAQMRGYLTTMIRDRGLSYGQDVVFLGYASAYVVAVSSLGTSLRSYFHSDDRGTPLDDIPLMKNLQSIMDFGAVINVASNTLPRTWITYGVGPYGFDLLVGCTAVQATDYYAFLQSGQIKGLVSGGKAAAEYETLLLDRGILASAGNATRALGSQSLALLTILGLILLGNA
ncbi:MAG: hypothetical protein MUC50_22870, partial [Myxococcota bacterium]|nr:hypothetical protein [Myxococcota bacterium]